MSTDAGANPIVVHDPKFNADPVQLSEGDTFAGLEIRGKLGHGGMAMVYRASDPEHDRDVALKLLNRGLAQDARHLERFRREARLVADLRHPRIVTVHGYGERDGCAYLTMQLIEGPTLADFVDQQGPLGPLHATQIVKQVARAIEAAHRQRVVHRDLKPSNIILHPDDGPVVLDFGLAKDLTRDPSLTEAGEILGTPSYLAPEQALPAGRPVDHRVDVHGLGALLFFTLTGHPPHQGDTAVEVVQRLLENEPERLRELDPELPVPLEIICAKALSRDPRDRYQTAAEMADDLERFQANEDIHAQLPWQALLLVRHIRRHPVATALVTALVALTATGAFAVNALTARLALHQRSEQGFVLLVSAQEHARAGRHAVAEREFLQAMLISKGAFLEDPSDPDLRAALEQIKRERAEYAESTGKWALAEELRQGLARLGEDKAPINANFPVGSVGFIAVEGLKNSGRVVFHLWSGEDAVPIATATATDPEVSLLPGKYLAIPVDTPSPHGSFLVVLDAGHRHRINLAYDAPTPPGAFPLPPASVLDDARRESLGASD
jgi:hypothetical protein